LAQFVIGPDGASIAASASTSRTIVHSDIMIQATCSAS
jgi:hypothetical protein